MKHGHHRRWRRRHRSWRKHHHDGHRKGWRLVRGIHRRVVTYLLLAVLLGLGGGWALHHAHSVGWTGTSWLVVITVLFFVWPLAWIATFRIARPVAKLAQVAGKLREGKLDEREHLSDDDDGEVAEVAGALHHLSDRVARQLEAQRALMAAVSHELRSPLARVRVLVELMREGNAPDGAFDDLQVEVDGMDALVGDLLAGARIDFEAVAPVQLDVTEVLSRALAAEGLDAELLTVEEGAETVHADPTLLGRAVSVMLDNARRYGGGAVGLTAQRHDDGVRITVLDGGLGLRDGEAEQMFEPFWRRPPEAGEARVAGTGLGLALVKQIARVHEGDAGAENRPEGGAAVWMDVAG